jgi:beta-glucanase (GH16 family)
MIKVNGALQRVRRLAPTLIAGTGLLSIGLLAIREARADGGGAVTSAKDRRLMDERAALDQNVEAGVNHNAKAAKKEEGKAITDPRKLGYHLTFADEFKGVKLDTSKWIDSYPDGVRTHSNNEQQYYAPDGYELHHGFLRLKAERRQMGGMPYTSGIVTTYGKFAQKYGWFEARLKVPQGKGMWPAFWLLPNDKSWPPEIDILEILGHEPTKVYLTNHYKLPNGQHEGKGDSFTGQDFSAEYHTFALEWKPTEILWYVDGIVRYRTQENVPSVPMYVLLNLAVGGDWPGNPDSTTPFPGNMDINYVRVYSKPTGVTAATATP